VSIYKTKKYVLAIDAPSYDAGPCTSGKRLSRRALIGTSLNSEPASQANVFLRRRTHHQPEKRQEVRSWAALYEALAWPWKRRA
jgi:hypothetical protein